MRRHLLSATLLALFTLVPAAARADDRPAAEPAPDAGRFGGAGHVALDDIIGLHAGGPVLGVPGAIGGFEGLDSIVGFSSAHGDVPQGGGGLVPTHTDAVGLVPRLGYVVPLARGVAFWPKVGAGYEVSGLTSDDASPATDVERRFLAEGEAGLAFSLAPFAYVDLTPIVRYASGRDDLAGSSRVVSFVAQAKLGLML